MSSPKETFRQILKQQHQSVTTARVAVFESLLGQEPMTMHQLVSRVADIDRASVYRAIDLFEKLGIVQRLNTGWKYKIELSDTFTDHHHHLTCIHCRRTVTLNEIHLESSIEQLAVRHGFKVSAHQIEIQGSCPECQTLKLI